MNVDVLAGFRAVGLDESIGISERLVVLGNTPQTASMAGTPIDVNHTFPPSNPLYGGPVCPVPPNANRPPHAPRDREHPVRGWAPPV